jgi:cation diffusion facilitator CzcD-associated flavoprotein CzcO
MIYNVLIIGGGISGIMSLKHLLEEGETNVIVLNKNKEPFGVWNINNHPSVLEFTYSVTSKLYLTISDFPIAKDVAEFPHHSVVLDYYKKYANHFGLIPYIKNNIEIIKVKKINNVWHSYTKDTVYQSRNIIVATGAVNKCLNYPSDSFFNNFTGEKYHSDHFKSYYTGLVNKKILVVGGSDTACDIAVFLSDKNNKVTVSMKNGRWFQPRFAGAYNSADTYYSRSLDFLVKNVVGKRTVHNVFGMDFIRIFYGPYGSGIKEWEPKCDYLNDYYVKSRDIVDAVAKGKIQPRKYIESIDGNKIKFIDNNTVSEFDVIIFATGYNTKGCFDFLEQTYDKKYKHIFVPEDDSIFFVGFIRPYLTSIPMLVELQSRWVSKVITNRVKLPSTTRMLEEIDYDYEKSKKEFPCAYKRIPIVDPYDYCNMIGKNIDALPNLFNLFFTNNELWRNIMYDSWNHHIYRLNDNDPAKVKIATNNIMENTENISSKLLRTLLVNIHFYTFVFIVGIIFIIVVIIKNNQKFKSLLYTYTKSSNVLQR